MGFENYISEDEAALLAGVSVSTLSRFAEAGYLGVETENDGLRMFSKREINQVFGIEDETIFFSSSPDTTEPTQRPPSVSSWASSRSASSTEDATLGSSTEVPPLNEKVVKSTYRPEGHYRPASPSMSSAAEPDARPTTTSSKGPIIERLEQEVTRLKAAQNLYERLITERERQVTQLEQERDWLRRRVERFEEKSDREQLLLLSETQVIRQLISERETRRSPLRAALEWCGLVDPQSSSDVGSSRATIEVGRRLRRDESPGATTHSSKS